MTRHHHVPDAVAHRAFRGSWAVTSGLLTKNQLRGSTFVRIFPDIYARRALQADVAVRLAALRLHLGDRGIVCGLTAAWVHGVWQPTTAQALPLEFVPSTRRLGRCADGDVVTRAGMHVTSPERTCFDLMRRHRLVEAVVVADAFTAAGVLTLPRLKEFCAERRRWPEVRIARLASTLAHAGARSPGESRLRMVVVLSGYDEPLVNVPVYGARGEHLGTPDLTMTGRRWVHLEYDGAYHDEEGQHGRDLRRQNALHGYGGSPLLRFDWRHVLRQRQAVLHDLARASGQPPRQDLDDRDFERGARNSRW